MAHSLRILHFGYQCPWTGWVIEQANQAGRGLGCALECVDAGRDASAAERYGLFSPFLTMIDESIRLPAPTPAGRLLALAADRGRSAAPAAPEPWQPQGRAERIEPLNAENLAAACGLCMPLDEEDGRRACSAKQDWMAKQAGYAGWLAFVDGRPVSALEYCPSAEIPFPIPGERDGKAFITCLYGASGGETALLADCRVQLLEHMIAELTGRFKAIQVIAGRRAAYPNGPAGLFAASGFIEVGVLAEVDLTVGWDEWVLFEYPISDLGRPL